MDARGTTRLAAASFVVLGILAFVDSAFANDWKLPVALGFVFLLAGWFVDSGPYPVGAGLGGLAALANLYVFFDWDDGSNGDWALKTATLVMSGLALFAIAWSSMKRRDAGIRDTDTTDASTA